MESPFLDENELKKLENVLLGLKADGHRVIIAIDGRCGSGKTTIAEYLADRLTATLFHMDDFFLRAEQRTKERLAQPGGNVDYERFIEEIMLPVRDGREVYLRRFCHETFQPGEPEKIDVHSIVIVEGSYSCIPALRSYYDFRVCVKASYEDRLKRIYTRSGPQKYEMFVNKWIPLEELYFTDMNIEDCCDYVISN